MTMLGLLMLRNDLYGEWVSRTKVIDGMIVVNFVMVPVPLALDILHRFVKFGRNIKAMLIEAQVRAAVDKIAVEATLEAMRRSTKERTHQPTTADAGVMKKTVSDRFSAKMKKKASEPEPEPEPESELEPENMGGTRPSLGGKVQQYWSHADEQAVRARLIEANATGNLMYEAVGIVSRNKVEMIEAFRTKLQKEKDVAALKEALDHDPRIRKTLSRLHVTDLVVDEATNQQAKWWQWKTMKHILGATAVVAATAATVMDGAGDDEEHDKEDEDEYADENEEEEEVEAHHEDDEAISSSDEEVGSREAKSTWTEHWDEDQQKPYWVHSTTHEVVWEDPYSDGKAKDASSDEEAELQGETANPAVDMQNGFL